MTLNIIFDGPPDHVSGRFVEVEDETGASINAGEWKDRGDGTWALVINSRPKPFPVSPGVYVNKAGTALTVTGLFVSRVMIGSAWKAETPGVFGFERILVTPEGLRDAGYERIGD